MKKIVFNNNKQLKALTMIELLIVVVIVGIVATFAMPAYRHAQQQAVDKEAQTLLKLIRAAEDMHRLETTVYTACPKYGATCNTLLSLDLPPATSSGGNWDYSVYNVTAAGDTFIAQARGDKGFQGVGGAWTIDQNGTTNPAF